VLFVYVSEWSYVCVYVCMRERARESARGNEGVHMCVSAHLVCACGETAERQFPCHSWDCPVSPPPCLSNCNLHHARLVLHLLLFQVFFLRFFLESTKSVLHVVWIYTGLFGYIQVSFDT